MEWRSSLVFDVPVKTVALRDGGTRDLTLDLYLPEHSPQRRADTGAPPLLVYIHGGGWREGHNDRPPAFRTILKRGLALASLEYRFSTQGSGEEMVADLVDGVTVARREAEARGCDADRWFIWGISAGGHLCSLAGQRLAATAIASWSGVFDLAHYATLRGVREELRGTVREIVSLLTQDDPNTMRVLSPLTHASPTSPPHIFVHGAEDRFVPPEQSRMMHEALTTAGVRSELLVVPDRDHAMPPEDSEEIHRTLDFLLTCPTDLIQSPGIGHPKARSLHEGRSAREEER